MFHLTSGGTHKYSRMNHVAEAAYAMQQDEVHMQSGKLALDIR